MNNNEKIWSILIHLNMCVGTRRKPFDEDFYDYLVEETAKAKLNMIVLDLGDAVQYASHPEISYEKAWTRNRVREEIKRCRDLGIEVIPKLNFSTTHSFWLGEYRNMTSSKIYYQVVNDLIKEVYELFEHPRFIHLGMDEEDARHSKSHQLAIFRQGELFWHDLRFLYDCVHDTGAMPWVWSCPLFRHPEEYVKRFDKDDAVLSPWQYNAIKKEHWTPIESRAEYVAYYNEGEYAKLGIKYVEEDPYLVLFREVALPLLEHGYKYIPCASVFNRCDWNHADTLEYFRDNAPDDQILGYMSAPWFDATWEKKNFYDKTFKFYREAKEKFYK